MTQKYDDVLLPFLSLMRRELHANSRKGDRPGWLALDANTLLLEVYWHAAKLSAAVKNNDGPAVLEHSADVANMAMMVLDRCGGLAWVAPQEWSTALDVTLTKDEAEYIAAFVTAEHAEDLGPGDDVVRLLVGDGHSGHGLYAAHPEYPEEGAIFVKAIESVELEVQCDAQQVSTARRCRAEEAGSEVGATPIASARPADGSAQTEGGAQPIGMRVDGWYCYGMPAEPLSPEQRAEVIDYARSFEECSYSRDELEALDDEGIVSAAYSAMADYARGQM